MKKILFIIPIAFLFFQTMQGVISKSPFRSIEKEKISDIKTQYTISQGNITAFLFVTIKGREITNTFFAGLKLNDKITENSYTILNDKNVQVAQMKKILFKFSKKDLNKK